MERPSFELAKVLEENEHERGYVDSILLSRSLYGLNEPFALNHAKLETILTTASP